MSSEERNTAGPGGSGAKWEAGKVGRRGVLRMAGCGGFWPGGFEGAAAGPEELPWSVRFRGEEKFQAMVKKALQEGWRSLPVGERVARFGKELHGRPYVSFTLEIDDRIEAPSANFEGLDCWTFFELSLGLARMIAEEKNYYGREDLLRQVQWTRYRGGICTGNYLQRIHYLAEWYFENEARGVVDDITKDLGGALPIRDRKCQEMTVLWKSYRYLRSNPDLLPRMAKLEEKVSQLPFYYVPQERVRAIESKLQNGDILGIVTRFQGAFCSHVGLAYRTGDGVVRLMHASSQKKYRRVVVDKSVFDYLKEFSGSIGIIVARPLEVSQTVTDKGIYRKRLAAATGQRALITEEDP